MSGPQPPPSRPWFRLATMMRPPPPPPAATPTATPNPSPAPPRPPILRPSFTIVNPPPQTIPTPPPPQQPTPTPTQTQAPAPPSPQQPTPTPTTTPPSPQQPTPTPTPTPPPPQQTNPTPSPQRPIPSVVRATDVVEPRPPAPPSPPPSPPRRNTPLSSPPTSPPRSAPFKAVNRSPSPPLTTTRALTPPSSPPKILKPLQQTLTPPQPNPIAPPPSPPSSPPPRSLSPPKRPHLILSPPASPPRPTPIQQIEHPLPPSSPPKPTTFSEQNSSTSSNTRPLSPLLLPSLNQKPYEEPAPEYQQKTMHVDQETKEKPKHSSSVNARSHIGGFHPHNTTRKPETLKKHWESSEDASGKNIITIAGENKGAIMNISDKKHEYGNNINSNRLIKPAESSDTEAKNKNENSNSSLMKTSYLNSNVQGVNNSILFNCSINHHDPGIHLTLSNGVHSKEHNNKRALI